MNTVLFQKYVIFRIWNAMTSSNILQPQTTATHRLQKHRYIVFKMQGMYWIIGYMFFLSK